MFVQRAMKDSPSIMPKGMILDFDGIILESVDIKGEAFKTLFKDYPQHQDEIFKYHVDNGGVPRFEKFKYIYRTIFKKDLSEEEFNRLCTQYSQIVLHSVLRCPFVDGAKEFLEGISAKCPLFIVSGTPHEEINFVVDTLHLRPHFKDVFGSPTSKKDWTRTIMADYGLKAEELFWVGDAMSDYDAARMHNIRFIARVIEGRPLFDKVKVFHKVKDLKELQKFVGTFL